MKLYIKALIVAFLVGSILLLINQFGALFGDQAFKRPAAVLTYCVPFIVFIAGKKLG